MVNQSYDVRTKIVSRPNHRQRFRPYVALLLFVALFLLVGGIVVMLLVYGENARAGVSLAHMAIIVGGVLLATLFPACVLIALSAILHLLTERAHDRIE